VAPRGPYHAPPECQFSETLYLHLSAVFKIEKKSVLYIRRFIGYLNGYYAGSESERLWGDSITGHVDCFSRASQMAKNISMDRLILWDLRSVTDYEVSTGYVM